MITEYQFKKFFFKKCPIFGPLAPTATFNLLLLCDMPPNQTQPNYALCIMHCTF